MRAESATYPAVADGLCDLAHLGGETQLPEGLDEVELPPVLWSTFLRKDHPALQDWGPEVWSRWPHVQVSIDNNVRSPMADDAAKPGTSRHIGAVISEFLGLGSLLAHSDFLATFPPIIMAQQMQVWDLAVRRAPVSLPQFRMRFFWSTRLARDPGSSWLREIVLRVYREEHAAAEALVAAALGVP